MGVREIGLQSESTSKAGEHFGMGVMLALFHGDGMKPSRMEALKMDANGWHKYEALSRRNQDGISSGPAAEWSFIDFNAFTMSSAEI